MSPTRQPKGFDRVRKLGAQLPDVTEGIVYRTPALKVGGKMFCCIPTNRAAEPGSLAVRMSYIERDLRLQAEPETYYLKPHYEGYPCVLARLDRLTDAELKELLEVGWHFTRAKAKRVRKSAR